MRLLLDTHALLWWYTADSRLSRRAQAAIQDETNDVLVSAASAWEIATKHRLGKLAEAPDAYPRFEELASRNGFAYVPISHRHGLRAGSYLAAHGDPFDRMLAAQADLDGLVLVTRDPLFKLFPVSVLW